MLLALMLLLAFLDRSVQHLAAVIAGLGLRHVHRRDREVRHRGQQLLLPARDRLDLRPVRGRVSRRPGPPRPTSPHRDRSARECPRPPGGNPRRADRARRSGADPATPRACRPEGATHRVRGAVPRRSAPGGGAHEPCRDRLSATRRQLREAHGEPMGRTGPERRRRRLRRGGGRRASRSLPPQFPPAGQPRPRQSPRSDRSHRR